MACPGASVPGMEGTGCARPAARRVPALGPVLGATVSTGVLVGALWWVWLGPASAVTVCPAVWPAPWWCGAESVRAHGIRITQALLLTYAAVVLAATLLHRRSPRAAWLPLLALPVAGWLATDAASL